MINKFNEEMYSEGEVNNMEVNETVEEVVIEATEPEIEVEETKEEIIEEVVEEVIESIEEPVVEDVTEVVETKEFSLEIFSLLFEEVPKSLEEIAVKLHERFNAMETKIKELEEFKSIKDKEELSMKVNEVVEEFATLEESEIEIIKAKALSNEIGLDEFRKELFCLVGMKALSEKETFSAKEIVEEVAIMDMHMKSETTDKYGGLVAKYKK